MKKLLLLTLLLLASSCASHKERSYRKLEKIVARYPEFIIKTPADTVYELDTFFTPPKFITFTVDCDSLEKIQKGDSAVVGGVTYKPKGDKFEGTIKLEPDTFIVHDTVPVPVVTNLCPPQVDYTWREHLEALPKAFHIFMIVMLIFALIGIALILRRK